jgi:hypothetical protein
MSQRFQIVNLPDSSLPHLREALSKLGHTAGTLGATGGPISGTSCSTTSANVIAGQEGAAASLKGDFTCSDSD